MAQATEARSISGMVRRPNMFFAPVGERRHQHFTAFEDAFDFEAHELVAAFTERLRRKHALLFNQSMDGAAQRAIRDAHKAPRLHEPHARREMRGRQQAREHFRVHRVGTKMAHVAARRDDAVDRVDLLAA